MLKFRSIVQAVQKLSLGHTRTHTHTQTHRGKTFTYPHSRAVTRIASVEGQPPPRFDLVDCCDLDLDPLTFISEADLDMIVTYLHAKN